MRHPLDSPEMQEALEAARRQGYAEGMHAADARVVAGTEALRNLRRVLWAAAMTHGGKLRVSATYIALAQGPADECQLEELWDPAHDETVVTARRRA